jgi:hypothetical protein
MILSSEEIRRQMLNDTLDAEVLQKMVPDLNEKKKEYAEIGNAIKRMTGTKGWKIFEMWLLSQINLNDILSNDPERAQNAKEKARWCSAILNQINFWITVGEKAEVPEA